MARSINLSHTDELRAFLDDNSGDGTLFSKPSERRMELPLRGPAKQLPGRFP